MVCTSYKYIVIRFSLEPNLATSAFPWMIQFICILCFRYVYKSLQSSFALSLYVSVADDVKSHAQISLELLSIYVHP